MRTNMVPTHVGSHLFRMIIVAFVRVDLPLRKLLLDRCTFVLSWEWLEGFVSLSPPSFCPVLRRPVDGVIAFVLLLPYSMLNNVSQLSSDILT